MSICSHMRHYAVTSYASVYITKLYYEIHIDMENIKYKKKKLYAVCSRSG